ncbi:uncharacterized protein LOC106658454 isoform X2 [Trichogramma pretiosum]|nr:uncharacterized protein LOC106658454 isoform X2 [Trichogramma pretiosum]
MDSGEVPSKSTLESTLDSEIDALSKIITNTSSHVDTRKSDLQNSPPKDDFKKLDNSAAMDKLEDESNFPQNRELESSDKTHQFNMSVKSSELSNELSSSHENKTKTVHSSLAMLSEAYCSQDSHDSSESNSDETPEISKPVKSNEDITKRNFADFSSDKQTEPQSPEVYRQVDFETAITKDPVVEENNEITNNELSHEHEEMQKNHDQPNVNLITDSTDHILKNNEKNIHNPIGKSIDNELKETIKTPAASIDEEDIFDQNLEEFPQESTSDVIESNSTLVKVSKESDENEKNLNANSSKEKQQNNESENVHAESVEIKVDEIINNAKDLKTDNCAAILDEPIPAEQNKDDDSFKTAEEESADENAGSSMLESSEEAETKDMEEAEQDIKQSEVENHHPNNMLASLGNLESSENEDEAKNVVEVNLSLEPEEYSSPIARSSIPEEVMSYDNSSSGLLKSDSSSVVLENPVEMETDLSQNFDYNQKLDDIVGHEQLASNSLSYSEKNIDSEPDSLSKTKEVTSETSDSFDKAKTLDENSENSSDSSIQPSNLTSAEENLKNTEIESVNRDGISIVFEESSQSPPMENDESINELYDRCVPNDAVEMSNDPVIEMDEKSQENSDPVNNDEIEMSDQFESTMSNVEKVSELESAVDCLQESVEQNLKTNDMFKIDHSVESSFVDIKVSDENVNIEDMDTTTNEIISNSIDTSEAEIISEAAKLEREHEIKLELREQFEKADEENKNINMDEAALNPTEEENELKEEKCLEGKFPSSIQEKKFLESSEVSNKSPLQTQQDSTIVVSDEDVSKAFSAADSKLSSESAASSAPEDEQQASSDETSESSSSSTNGVIESRKQTPEPGELPEKHSGDKQQQLQYENVGSPRIILKIAKSAITDCSEPRSPMSPKIRSATNSPAPEDQKLGKIKLKLSRGGHPSIIQSNETSGMEDWHTDSPSTGSKRKLCPDDDVLKPETSIGMKIKLSKSGDASIVQPDTSSTKDASQTYTESLVLKKQDSPSIGMKIKLSKSGDASIVQSDEQKERSAEETRTESPIGMKIKLSKTGDASVVLDDISKTTEMERTSSPMGSVKIKLSKTKDGNASIISNETEEQPLTEISKKAKVHDTMQEHLGMKIKLSKTGDPSIVQEHVLQKPKEDAHIEMKIKLSKTGHPTIVNPSDISEDVTIKALPSQIIDRPVTELSYKRTEVTISPIESKKMKLDLNPMQPPSDFTIQPVPVPQPKLMLDSKSGSISRQQMNVFNREISITPVSAYASVESSMSERLKSALNAPTESLNTDCEIIEHQAEPELVLVNEESCSSQDVMIMEDLPPVKIPKKRGRPRRNPLPAAAATIASVATGGSEHLQDPLNLDQSVTPSTPGAAADNSERPRRTCRVERKSYAPPKRGGRGRGRGKRKSEPPAPKRSRIEIDYPEIEATEPIVTLKKLPIDPSAGTRHSASELFRALNQPTVERTAPHLREVEIINLARVPTPTLKITPPQVDFQQLPKENVETVEDLDTAPSTPVATTEITPMEVDSMKLSKAVVEEATSTCGKENWLAPTEPAIRGPSEPIAAVLDEETRMSAECGSRSHTPARNVPTTGMSEPLVNDESQGSTATTESEKIKVQRTRRMEINFDPDEGPFTVEKIAEYEWPRRDETKPSGVRGETFMIQEQISQYLGVKSFKRKYPDLKRRMVDMEERNYLREHGLVSESMCDMGLTAVSSSEVLDIMCTDFPEQYEEYRKYTREKQVKEHSKKQKELAAAANAERNRIDLAEMAMQSAINFNTRLNKSRLDSRTSSLDLQTFTVHKPKRPVRYDPERRSTNHYPCSVIPGQFAEFYREYNSNELRYFPLNTVMYGPMKPNERQFDSQSDGSQSESDSDSTSGDSSSSSSDEGPDSEEAESQSTMGEIDVNSDIKCKMCSNHLNKLNQAEILIACGKCSKHVHPSCTDLTLDMVPHIRTYPWQCTDCKTCAQCHDPADEDKMLFCDMCDRGFHIYCVGLRRVPSGRWHCQECAVCSNCNSKEPGGINHERNSVAQWQHEYKKAANNTQIYIGTFCVPCSK